MSDLVERFKAMRGMGAVIIEGAEISAVCDRIDQLERENAALLADARRYEWLRIHYGLHALHVAREHLLKAKHQEYIGSAQALDAAIDAAMEKEKA